MSSYICAFCGELLERGDIVKVGSDGALRCTCCDSDRFTEYLPPVKLELSDDNWVRPLEEVNDEVCTI